ncbi:MAG: hypothetical protein ACOCWI_01310 [Bacillota bacterium]
MESKNKKTKTKINRYKKVYDNRGKVVGFVKPIRKLYPHFDITELLNSVEANIKRIEFQGGGDGYLDKNGNVFTSNEIYVGNLKNPKRVFIPISIAFILIIFVTLTTFYATVIMGRAGFPTISLNYPQISIMDVNNDLQWSDRQELNILENTYGEKVLYPGANGKYGFVVDNKTSNAMVYNILISDINEHNIPIRYRLKANNIYVASSKDSWQTIDNINLDGIYLSRFSSVVYEIEWFWPDDLDDEYDTSLGNQQCRYLIEVKVNAQFVND